MFNGRLQKNKAVPGQVLKAGDHAWISITPLSFEWRSQGYPAWNTTMHRGRGSKTSTAHAQDKQSRIKDTKAQKQQQCMPTGDGLPNEQVQPNNHKQADIAVAVLQPKQRVPTARPFEHMSGMLAGTCRVYDRWPRQSTATATIVFA
eukprot:156575-Chlamydomonas_euryale.AAC.3